MKNKEEEATSDKLCLYAGKINSLIDSIGIDNTAKNRGVVKIELMKLIAEAGRFYY